MSPRQKSPSSLSDDTMDPQSGALHSPDESRQTRRATRAQHTHADDVDQQSQPNDADADADGDGDGDDEVTRCICGLQDYPGPPLTDDFPTITDPSQAEDAGGLFIQCDKCHVWQHGGCVGIMDESKSPDNYFCELCDKKLHNVLTDPKGQRYSRYLPVMKPEPKTARKASLTKETESAKARREQRESQNRASVESSTGKRRSTMNSRQAYDDEETLRRVIEETKSVGELTPAVRKGKRGRDDSEDSRHEIKRQRTGSESPNPPSTLNTASLDADSDDDGTQPKNKRVRNAAAEALRQREARERERTRDEKRKEAAGRRSERAGRRRVDGTLEPGTQTSSGELTTYAESDPLDDTPRPMGTPILPNSQPPSPPASAPPLAPGSSHKKGTVKKQKRLGRNQYSAAKASTNTSDANATAANPNGSSGDDPITNSTSDSKNSPSSNNETPAAIISAPPAKSKPGKWAGRAKNPRQAAIQEAEMVTKDNRDNKSQMTITDMKKRTGMMMDYIAKAQVDMAGDGSSLNAQLQAQQSADFKELSSREMMDVLTRHIMIWQKEYAGEAPTAAAASLVA
ncbi:hypothetical protein AUEXF2481DRAFT_33465 [Aureobasidium subglaciale EXF-2481]|uniref:Zinc finger PHD-type domain-containing protein n=1 Tax=Aureobasidium subglaciale (strain EXF-2481) TaxID=1043005 RepID=A0A074XZL5_AURSE|nr:uncharacterized protein AUEXF2481DRAFT_33465 [Aureobasidium subglaciale EXF-2481]KAI5212911.1 hypothetical protein E4T38_00278 [Aureobasidium subglaciale]KAI5232444.1 hypothetical protein E4T40_00277 [Aureobasidium subglaciale]KAI5234814.1 hypothetical protein E4T41_00277 [Aureobasidium subglaciale]KAI5268409.1 hypothetical protein E4T46_00277 [Aureobasidium subglaciale]KEQ90988.1 hypothetical protein AUEXF2481DRAFT_33465 [Aureobasidium subglaciale EXF-2481]